MAAMILLTSISMASPQFCDWLRDFVSRYGQERSVEIAKALKHTDAEIAAARRLCFPSRGLVNNGTGH